MSRIISTMKNTVPVQVLVVVLLARAVATLATPAVFGNDDYDSDDVNKLYDRRGGSAARVAQQLLLARYAAAYSDTDCHDDDVDDDDNAKPQQRNSNNNTSTNVAVAAVTIFLCSAAAGDRWMPSVALHYLLHDDVVVHTRRAWCRECKYDAAATTTTAY